MNYSDKQTERRIARLERELRGVYSSAFRDISATIDSYMRTWAVREKSILNRLESGDLQPPAGDTIDSYMRKWRLNHVGMGKRWESVRQTIVDRMVNANVHSADLINGTCDSVYAVNRNYQAYLIESLAPSIGIGKGKTAGIAFNLVNEAAVRHLESGKKQLLPRSRVDIPKDKQWNMRKVQAELLSAILQGKSTDKIAKDFARVTDMNRSAAMRNARTACGAAQCAGKQANLEEAEEMGIVCMKEWVATLDDKTRDSHQRMDGERIAQDDIFSNGCRFPCDPLGDPAEVYNCRCTMKTVIEGVNDERGRRIARNDSGKTVYLENVTYSGRDDSRSYAQWFQSKIDGAESPDQAKEYYDEARSEGLNVHR